MARLVAVDCHRHTWFVVVEEPDGTESLVRRFPVSLAGERELIAGLQPGDQIVMEATFGVFRLAERLESTGAQVTVIDPGQSPLVGLRGKKTDYRDCRALLKAWRAGALVAVWRPDPLTRQIRQLTSERMAYNGTIVRFKNRITALLWDEGLEAPTSLWTPEGAAWLPEQPLRPEVHEHDVRRGGEPDDRAGLTPVAGEDVGHVRAVRSGVRRIAAGRVVAERRRRVGFLQRRIDHLAREQTSGVVRRRREPIARAALIPEAHEARRAIGIAEIWVGEVQAPVADADHYAAAVLVERRHEGGRLRGCFREVFVHRVGFRRVFEERR